MGWIIAVVILPSCVCAAWLVVRRPLRQVFEEVGVDQAKILFHRRREWLEAGFLSAISRLDPIERVRWEEARWLDPVTWARDHKSRYLIALVEVQFPGEVMDLDAASSAGHATAIFEYRRGRWVAEGVRLQATRPADVFHQPGRFEPLARPPIRG